MKEQKNLTPNEEAEAKAIIVTAGCLIVAMIVCVVLTVILL